MNLMYYHKNELRLHLNRPQWSSTQARARKHMTRARAQILISIVKSALLSRQTRSMTPICRLVKGYQNWYATSSGQPGDQSSVFYIIDIDWRWDQKLLLYFRLPAGRDQYCPQRMIQREKLGTLYLTLYISIIFFPFTLSSYFIYN